MLKKKQMIKIKNKPKINDFNCITSLGNKSRDILLLNVDP